MTQANDQLFSSVDKQTPRGTMPKSKRRELVAGEMDQYLLEHDEQYVTGACFHLKFYWIFSRGPNIQEKVIKRLTRGIKDISEGCFKA